MKPGRVLVASLLAAAAPMSLSVAYAHQAPAAAPAATTPVPKEQLLKPGPEADHYVVVSDAGKHGDMWRWTLPDGRIAFRHSQSLRGWITETDATVRYGPDGRPTEIVVRGITPSGDASETYTEEGGNARWTSIVDSGTGPVGKKIYLPSGGPGLVNARLIELIAAAGEQGVELLPSGRASITFGPSLAIQGPAGSKTVKLAFLRGILSSPLPVWVDENNKYFADVGWISVMPAGYEANAKAMRDA